MQSGTTFYVSSGTVLGPLNVNGVLTENLNVDGTGGAFTCTTPDSGSCVALQGSANGSAATGVTEQVGVKGSASGQNFSTGLNGTATGSFINFGAYLSASGGSANHGLSIAAGDIYLGSQAGTSGQVLTSQGANALPAWTTPSAGGGTGGNLTNLASQFAAPYYSFASSSNTISGSTGILIYPSSITVNGAKPILSTSTLQSGATFYVSSGTVDQQLSIGGAQNGLVIAPTQMGISTASPFNIYESSSGTSLIKLYTPGMSLLDIVAGNPAVVISTGNLRLAKNQKLYFSGSGNSYVSFRSTGTNSNVNWVLPSSDAAGCWQSDGAGNLSILACPGGTSGNGYAVQPATVSFNLAQGVTGTTGTWTGGVTAASLTVSGIVASGGNLSVNGGNLLIATADGTGPISIFNTGSSGQYKLRINSPNGVGINQSVIAGQDLAIGTATINGQLTLKQTNTILATDSNGLVVSTTVSGGSSSLPSTQTWTGQNNWTTPSQSTFTYGLAVGSLTVVGSAPPVNLSITENGLNGQIVISTAGAGITPGHCLMAGSSITIVDAGAACGSGSGGTPGGATSNIQYNNAGSFAGSNNWQINGTSMTIVSSVSISNTASINQGGSGGTRGPGYLDVFNSNTTLENPLFTVGDNVAANQFVVNSGIPVFITEGARTGGLYVGGYGGTNSRMIFTVNEDFYSQYINLSNSGEMDFRTAKVSESGIGGSMVFSPAGVSEVVISSFNVTISTSVTMGSSVTINSTLTVSSNTALNGVLAISSNVTLSGAAGTNGQVLTSGGPNTVPTWTTVSGGSGSGIVSPGTFTWTNNSFGASFSTVTVSTLTVTIKAILPGATFYINRAAGATTQEVDVSSLSVKNGLHSYVNAGDGSDALIIDQNDTTNNKDGIIINSSGTGNGFLVNGNGLNYGTSSGSSGAALISCANPVTDGYCAQVYSNQGALGDLFAPLFVSVNNAAFDNPSFYIQSTTSTSPQNGIRIDGKDYSTIEFIDTLRSGVGNLSHNGKFQISSHNDSMRGERRCPLNSDGFCSAYIIDDSTGPGIVAFANDYSRPVSTVDIQGSLGIGLQVAGNTAAPVSGLLVQGNSIFLASQTVSGASTFKSSITVQGALSISSTVLVANSPGVSGQVLTSGGQGAVATWATPSSGGGGYAMEPATVTLRPAQGITISSRVIISTPLAVITTTSTITSTMSVVLASAAATTTNWITLTLPSAASSPGVSIMIYKVDKTTGQVRVQGAGTDLIEGTNTIRLDAYTQHASLYSTGNEWVGGLGGIQYTPARAFAIQQMSNGFQIGTSSTQVMCAINVPVPVAVTGFAYYQNASANMAFGLLDANGNVVVSTGPIAGTSGVKATTTTPVMIPPGRYYITVLVSAVIAGIMDGEAPNNGTGVIGCGAIIEGGASTIQPAPMPLTNNAASAPALHVLFNGGDSTFQ